MKKCRAIIVININIVINSVTSGSAGTRPRTCLLRKQSESTPQTDAGMRTSRPLFLGVLLFPLLFSGEVGGGTNRKTGSPELSVQRTEELSYHGHFHF